MYRKYLLCHKKKSERNKVRVYLADNILFQQKGNAMKKFDA